MDIEYAKNRFFGVSMEIDQLNKRIEKLKKEQVKCFVFVMGNE